MGSLQGYEGQDRGTCRAGWCREVVLSAWSWRVGLGTTREPGWV